MEQIISKNWLWELMPRIKANILLPTQPPPSVRNCSELYGSQVNGKLVRIDTRTWNI